MARFGADPAYHKIHSVESVGGRILSAGGGTYSVKAGKGFTLTYLGTGNLQLTFDVNYPYIIQGGLTIVGTSNAYIPRIQSYVGGPPQQASGSKVSINILIVNTSNSPTELAANEELWFSFDFARTQVP